MTLLLPKRFSQVRFRFLILARSLNFGRLSMSQKG